MTVEKMKKDIKIQIECSDGAHDSSRSFMVSKIVELDSSTGTFIYRDEPHFDELVQTYRPGVGKIEQAQKIMKAQPIRYGHEDSESHGNPGDK